MPSVIRAPDLRQQVYESLRENIRTGHYPPETRFLEKSVAEEFGVSRTPAREALALLVQDGLIVQEGRGFRFPVFTVDEIMDIYEVRLRLEPFAVRRAVERATPEALRDLAGLMRRELDLHGDKDSYVQANRRMRGAIFGLVQNARLLHAIQANEEYTHYVRVHTLNDAAIRAKSVEGNYRLLDAIEARDPEAAEISMAHLLLAARQAIIQQMDEASAA
jgi:DNA-binding GntR family transcriptional regulator